MKKYKKRITKYSLVREDTNICSAKLRSSYDVYDYLKNEIFKDIDIYESFYIITLNTANNITGYNMISKGGLNSTIVDIRLIAKFAIESLSPSVIIAHNHPSGNIKPSESDKNLTEKILKGLKLLDITLIDSIILTKEGYFSFADEGLL